MREAKNENNKISRIHATAFIIFWCIVGRFVEKEGTGEEQKTAAKNVIRDPRVFLSFV